MSGGSIFNFFSIKDSFIKRRCATKKKLRRLGPCDCQEQFTNAICGKYVAKIFNFTFVSKIKFPFQKVVFARNIARVS